MRQPPVRVLKLGGSLLTLPDLPQRVRSLIADARWFNLLFVGGGALCDAMRDWDRLHPMPAAKAHWLCIDLLATTGRLVHGVLPELTLLETPAELTAWWDATRGMHSSPHSALALPASFYRPGVTDAALPESWATTSDSLAAWLALRLQAELWLLKSCDPAGETDFEAWHREGLVDEAFPQLAPRLASVRVVNLRAAEPPAEREI